MPPTAAALRLSAFKQARERLRQRLLKDEGLEGLTLSQTTLWRLSLSEEGYPSERFTGANQERLIQYFDGARPDPIYRAIAAQMGRTETDGKKCIEEFSGQYHLFSSPREESGPLLDRRLEILEIAGNPCFKQWPIGSHEGEPEHSGFVVHDDGKLFLQGLRNRIMSLTIVRAFAVERPMSGVMLSIFEADEDRKPFVTKVVMIRTDNFNLVEKMLSPDGKAFFDEVTRNVQAFI